MTRIAQASRHGMAYVKESEAGVTPENPQMTSLRYTGCSLNLSRDSFTSSEIRPDRQIADVRTGTNQVSGDLGFELSFGEYDEFLAAALGGNWKDDELRSGVEETSFTLERSFTDIGEYIRYTGCFVNTLQISLQPNAMATGSFGITGLDSATFSAPLMDAPASSRNSPPYDTYTGELKENGAVIAVVTGLDLNLDNGIQPQFVLFRRSAPFVSWGKSNLSGTMTAFFEDMGLIRKFLDETPTSLEFTLRSDGGSYTFLLPRIRYTGAELPLDADGPVSISMPFQAILDECTGTNLIIRREAAAASGPQACSLAWSAEELAANAEGAFTDSISITLSGGEGKTFAGRDNAALPGVSLEGLPDGLEASLLRKSPTSLELSLSGQAEARLTDARITLKFSASAFNRGYCHCPGDSVANSEKSISLDFTASNTGNDNADTGDNAGDSGTENGGTGENGGAGENGDGGENGADTGTENDSDTGDTGDNADGTENGSESDNNDENSF